MIVRILFRATRLSKFLHLLCSLLSEADTAWRWLPTEQCGADSIPRLSMAPCVARRARNESCLLCGRTWGWNGKGQLGRSDKGSVIPAPGKVAGISECVFVAAGHEESLAIDSSGSLWSLGGGREQPVNVAEMLRLTTEELRLLRRETRTEEGMLSSAQQREGAEKIKFVHAASGVMHGAAVTSEGECVAWGKHNGGGGEGVLSRGLPEGVMIWRPSDGAALVQVECGWRHTVARDSEGRVWTFGGGKSGNKWKQLGARAGPSADKAAVPAPLAGWGGDGDAPSARPAASKVAAGWSHTVVLSEVPPSLARATHAGPARALWG